MMGFRPVIAWFVGNYPVLRGAIGCLSELIADLLRYFTVHQLS
jgi:hypothetical protein